MSLLPHITVESASNPNASVIWLHGLGADGHDFQPIVAELNLPENAAIRFIFPHAPSLPVTINGGMTMPAWYDILEMSIDRQVDELQLRKSSAAISDFIENEIAQGVKSERIIIAGFSQGGAVALETALSYPKKLAGILAMSTYFATKNSISHAPENKEIAIEIQHGIHDPVVPVSLGEANFKLLQQSGYDVNFRSYPMQHAVCPQQIKDIRHWLVKVLHLE